jgi:tRNA-splicing ligase RtcB
MMTLQNLEQLSKVVWEIPRSYRSDMRVPARVFASRKQLEDILHDRSLDQLVNVSTLPGITRAAMVMPDVHEGYGFPIGGVAAMEWPDGVISPGGIGYDINCGVRLLKSPLTYQEVRGELEPLAHELSRLVPSGMGRGGVHRVTVRELDEVMRDGLEWAVRKGFAYNEDARHIESRGRIPEADPSAVSKRAKERGLPQLGTMGSGNHFVEVDRVDALGDEKLAEAFGLFPDQIVILIHTGSRGLGHQVATDYIRTMMQVMPEYGIKIPDRELACAPYSSPEGESYFGAMAAAANFAWVNRQVITTQVREAWHRVLGGRKEQIRVLYDVAHNIAKIETHRVNGEKKKLIIHRKGATRAFPPGDLELVDSFRETGQPVIIPGSMGTASYVLAGTEGAMSESFGSSCHGAGRRMSRTAAKKRIHGRVLRDELRSQGIVVKAGSNSGLAEEAPFAYKDVHSVVEVVRVAGIANIVARLVPVAVVKG